MPVRQRRTALILGVFIACVLVSYSSGAVTVLEKLRLVPGDGAVGDGYGGAVAVDRRMIVVGSPGHDHSDLPGSGGAYVYEFFGVGFTDQGELVPEDGSADSSFGASVAIWEDRSWNGTSDTVLVGAPLDDELGEDVGAVYVFTWDGTAWTQQAKLLPGDARAGMRFGESVAIYDDFAFVGAPYDDAIGNDSGSVYAFERDGVTWTEYAKLIPNDGAAADHFGSSLSAGYGLLLIGARSDDDLGNNSGSAYLFTLPFCCRLPIQQDAKLLASDGIAGDEFGTSVSISDSGVVIVGALNGTGPGSAYVFEEINDTPGCATCSDWYWSEQAKLTAEDPGSFDNFGKSVSAAGEWALVGSWQDNDQGVNSGSAYLFQRDGTSWIQREKLRAPNGQSEDRFGAAVALDRGGRFSIVGAPGDDEANFSAGATFLYSIDDSVAGRSPPGIVSMQDLNGNGAPELATIVVDDIDPNVHIRDGATGELIADIAFNTEISFDLEVLPDISGNGAPEIAVFGAQLNTLGRNIQVQIRDSETGLIVQRIWDSNSYEAISMATIPDYSGGFGEPPNDAPEIAILSRHIDDEFHKVSIRDSLTFNTIDNVFTGPKAVGHDLVVLNDTSGNEIPEIGVLGVLKDNDQVRVQALDAESGSVLTNIFLGGVYQPRALMIMPDINGNATDEIVALGVDPATQNVRIQVRDSLNTKKAKRVLYNIWLGNANEAIALELVEDINGNGFADIAVLLKTPDGVGRVRVQDGGDGEFIRNLFFSGVEEPTDLTAVEDYDGNGFGELAVLGEKNGIRHVQVLDSSTGTQLNQIDFPDGE